MPFYEREEKLLSVLAENKVTDINELATKLFVSLPTVRRDLKKLEARGIISRSGGKILLQSHAADERIPFILRENEQNAAKINMAKKAAALITDGDTIMTDATTSTLAIIPYLKDFHNIIVITSSAKASVILANMGIKSICTGGLMINESFSYTGADAENTAASYNADILFFSCRGVNEQGALTDNSIEENNLRRVMMKHARKKIFMCDSSKIGHTYLNTLCTLSDIDGVICEKELPDNFKNMINNGK